MAHLSSLQMELTGCRQREAELKTQLASSVAESQRGAETLASIKKSHDGLYWGKHGSQALPLWSLICTTLSSIEMQLQLSQMTSDLKEERVSGKRMKGDIQQLQDDLAEATTERDSLQRV